MKKIKKAMDDFLGQKRWFQENYTEMEGGTIRSRCARLQDFREKHKNDVTVVLILSKDCHRCKDVLTTYEFYCDEKKRCNIKFIGFEMSEQKRLNPDISYPVVYFYPPFAKDMLGSGAKRLGPEKINETKLISFIDGVR